AGQTVHALNDGQVSVHLDLGPHALELIGVAEAAGPHAVGDDAGPLGQAQGGGHLGLHVGGEAGVGQGLDVGADQRADAADQKAVVHLLNVHAHLAHLGGNTIHVLGDDV